MIHKNILKTYAPEARRDFIKAVTERAAFYGITEKKIFPCEIKGDFAFISGRPFPKDLDKKRKELIARVEKSGFTHVMEEIAYTWFNRLVAIRFMEVNGYLSHGYRVLSHPEGHPEPELLEKAQFIDKLDGLEKAEIIKLKMAAGKESELYRRLLIAQCNDLSAAIPFLFQRLDDPTELLLSDNLLNTDSVIRVMVNTIPEEDWKEVEIVGWMHQFYIAEKKDALMKAKTAYKSEDIPAVTQLFTPKWIVKYLVQNSLGAKWLGTYPGPALKAKMEYYIEPAEQTGEVKAKLKEITPEALNPEDLTVMDPACGSGHILVEAYDLLKEIYLERGYRPKDIPAFILTKNLYGLEIDERAAQLARFALLMKAYADDREIFKKSVKPNIICLKSGNGVSKYFKEAKELVELFENAKTFGSLIRVPEDLRKKLSELERIVDKKKYGDMFEQKDAEIVTDLLKQADLLSKRYDCVIANPPYMGGKFMNAQLKEFVKNEYKGYEKDLFSAFIIRGRELARENGNLGFMSPFVWMFISSHEDLRLNLIDRATLTSLIQFEYSGFAEATVPICTFTFNNAHYKGFIGSFIRLSEFRGAENQAPKTLEAIRNKKCGWFYTAKPDDFKKILGSPIAYWVSNRVREIFDKGTKMVDIFDVKQGMATSDNDRFLRYWHEVSIANIKFDCSSLEESQRIDQKWFPYNKGGDFRLWYGNNEYVVNWWHDGKELKEFQSTLNQGWHVRLKSREFYFKPSINWSFVSSAYFGVRYSFSGFIFDVGGSSTFPVEKDMFFFVGYLCSKMAFSFMQALNPTLNFQVENVGALPVLDDAKNKIQSKVNKVVLEAINISKADWDSLETSWDFIEPPLFNAQSKKNTVNESYQSNRNQCRKMTEEMKRLEEENNRIFIGAYGLQDELAPDAPIEEITLFANPKYRYKGKLTDDELEVQFKAETMKELISYSVGCMMGRYSLDVPRLVYAHAENKGVDPKKYKTFPADEDGIIPITEREWFDDDAASRFFRFIEIAWDKKCRDENLDFIAEALGRKSAESSNDAIRRYFTDNFFRDHCQTYKNRPIYWLFTSGKEKAFQALVYLHRYNEGTLSRMRTEYVLPLQTKIARKLEHLEKDKDAAASASAANKLQKEIDILRKHKEELFKFDEQLRHYADMKIKLDLDDGVNVNYEKFSDLLEAIK